MNTRIRKSVIHFRILIVISILFVVSAFTVAISTITRADNGQPLSKGRLITIHDRGTEKIILSQASTIGDALEEAGISIDSKDAVEPAITEKLVASDYQVNIYRSRPVIIVDGNTRTKVNNPYKTALQIAQSAGITIHDEDIVTLDRSNDIVSEGAGLQLTIKRATPFEFTLYGKTSTIRTQAKTVGEMFTEKGIKLESNDHSSLSTETVITEGLAIRVWREGKQTIAVDEEINFDIENIEDADREVGYQLIKTLGEKGQKSVTYEITVQDGQEVGRTEIASIIALQPKKQVQIVGVKGQYTTPSENENITWDYLIMNGYNRVQAAGIMGNLMQEHRFETSGDGLAQWTDGRRAELFSKPYPTNIYTQLEFLVHELSTNYASVGNEIKSSNSLYDVTQIFQNKYEKCGLCMESLRYEYARNILASH